MQRTPKTLRGHCTDDGGCSGGGGGVCRRCRFPPQTVVVFSCLCVFVCASVSHAEGREYYYFDLLHPPPFNECSGLFLFRAVRRTRHVIIPPQQHRSDGGRNEISKSLQKPLFFFVHNFLTKNQSLPYSATRNSCIIAVAVVVVSSRHRGRPTHTWLGDLPIFLPRPSRIGPIVRVYTHAS